MDWIQLLQLVGMPIILALVGYVIKLREDFSAFKLEVAKTYATISYLKDVETRLGSQLNSLDRKLDRLLERRADHG